MSAPIRVVVVDDEPPARRKLARLLGEEDGVEIAGEAGSGPEAVAVIEDVRPDLVFLDVQMPGVDGFGVLNALDVEPLPAVIFVTAHDTHAVRAFEVHALDYLLKPVAPERFRAALARAKAALAASPSPAAGDSLRAAAVEEVVRPLDRILVRAGGKAVFVRVEEVDWITADRNYVDFHAAGRSYTVRGTLGGVERRLEASRFVRINKSQIVNLDRVREVHPWSHGESVLVMVDGAQLTTSRRYREGLAHLFDPGF